MRPSVTVICGCSTIRPVSTVDHPISAYHNGIGKSSRQCGIGQCRTGNDGGAKNYSCFHLFNPFPVALKAITRAVLQVPPWTTRYRVAALPHRAPRQRLQCARGCAAHSRAFRCRGCFQSKHRRPWTSAAAIARRPPDLRCSGETHGELFSIAIQQFTQVSGSQRNRDRRIKQARHDRVRTSASGGRSQRPWRAPIASRRAQSARDTASLRNKLSWRMTASIQSCGNCASLPASLTASR